MAYRFGGEHRGWHVNHTTPVCWLRTVMVAAIAIVHSPLIGASQEPNPPGDAVESPPSPDQVVLRETSAHAIRYYLSLPKTYRPESDQRWPVLICVTGAD